MDIDKLIKIIDNRLKELNIPKMQFYSECGITASAISRWKSGRANPSVESLENIASYLKISYEELISGQKEKPASNTGNGRSVEEMELVNKYRLLNNSGKSKIDEYITLLSESDRYIKTYHSGQSQVG